MKIPAFIPRGGSRAVLSLSVAFVLVQPLPAAGTTVKDHTIFVGHDVAIARKGKFHRVVGAEKNALHILVDRKLTVVPLSEVKDLRVDRGVKLSNLSASVTNLHGAMGESRLRAATETETMLTTMALQDMQEEKRDKVLKEVVWGAIMAQKTDGTRTPVNTAESAMEKAVAQLPDITNNINRMAQTGNDLVTGRSGPEGGLNDTGFVVSFEASAPVPLEQCHVAVIADYSLPGNSGLSLSSVTLEPLGTLGPVARKFSCEVRRFPPGAELKGYRLAIYSRGQEIATNLSSRRTDISRDETVLYLTMDHLARHPGETLPPTPILMVPRAEFVSRLGSAPLDQVFYARVGQDGKIIRLSTDATGRVRLPSDLNSAVDQIAFVPAIEKGKPVEGVAKLKLADLIN